VEKKPQNKIGWIIFKPTPVLQKSGRIIIIGTFSVAHRCRPTHNPTLPPHPHTHLDLDSYVCILILRLFSLARWVAVVFYSIRRRISQSNCPPIAGKVLPPALKLYHIVDEEWEGEWEWKCPKACGGYGKHCLNRTHSSVQTSSCKKIVLISNNYIFKFIVELNKLCCYRFFYFKCFMLCWSCL